VRVRGALHEQRRVAAVGGRHDRVRKLWLGLGVLGLGLELGLWSWLAFGLGTGTGFGVGFGLGFGSGFGRPSCIEPRVYCLARRKRKACGMPCRLGSSVVRRPVLACVCRIMQCTWGGARGRARGRGRGGGRGEG